LISTGVHRITGARKLKYGKRTDFAMQAFPNGMAGDWAYRLLRTVRRASYDGMAVSASAAKKRRLCIMRSAFNAFFRSYGPSVNDDK